MVETPQRECAWCGTVEQTGSYPPSHGICEGCFIEVAEIFYSPAPIVVPHYQEPRWARYWRDWGGEA